MDEDRQENDKGQKEETLKKNPTKYPKYGIATS